MTVAEKLLIWLGTGNLVKAHNIILLEKRPLLTLFLTIEVVSKLASFNVRFFTSVFRNVVDLHKRLSQILDTHSKKTLWNFVLPILPTEHMDYCVSKGGLPRNIVQGIEMRDTNLEQR